MKNLENIIIAIKVVVSLFIAYLAVFSIDAGALINAIGNFIVSGNYIIGFGVLLFIIGIYPLLLHNLTVNRINLCKLKNKIVLFDIILIISTLILGVGGSAGLYKMPLPDALSMKSVLIAGSTVLYMLLTFAMLTILMNTTHKKVYSADIPLKANNNPFTYTGRIAQVPFIITKVCLGLVTLVSTLFSVVVAIACLKYPAVFSSLGAVVFSASLFIIIVFLSVMSVYSTSKRLRDVEWSQWLLILSLLFAWLFFDFILFFVKSKYITSGSKEEETLLKDS